MAEARKYPWSRDVRCISCARIVNCGYFHAGFSELFALYCDHCENTGLLNKYEVPADDVPEEYYSRHLLRGWRTVEQQLEACVCGGRFSFMNPPRCPHCKGPLLGDIYEDKPILKVIDLHPVVPGATQKLRFPAPRPATQYSKSRPLELLLQVAQ